MEWEYSEFGGRPIRLKVRGILAKLNFESHPRLAVGILAYLRDIAWDQNIFKAAECDNSTISKLTLMDQFSCHLFLLIFGKYPRYKLVSRKQYKISNVEHGYMDSEELCVSC